MLGTYQPVNVPSDAYASMIDEGGEWTPSMDALVWGNSSVLVRSNSMPTRTAPLMSLSNGGLGADVSSSDRFDQFSSTHPATP